MPVNVRRIAVVVALLGVMAAVAISRHTTAQTVSLAASATPRAIGEAADLEVLSPGPPQSIEQASGWLNSPPLTDASLRGDVVLYDFWTYACVNCQHTLPHMKAWQERYSPDGLRIVSIHTPEFDFEAVPDNVSDYLTSNGISYPVALDPDRSIWRSWENHYWPAFYLYDQQGRLRVRHFGEGGYDSMEDAIRVLLGVDPNSGRAAVG
jgi:thiol-disulfide isomerase/thioredoxin